MTDTDARLQKIQDGWQTMSTGEQQRAIGELDALRADLDPATDGPLLGRIEALRADLTLTVGLQPATEEQGVKG